MKAKKSYGQHFLIDEEISSRIAASLTLSDGLNNVLEVGPGKGMLTKYLIEKGFNFKAVEADRDMVSYLQENYPQLDGKIISEDFLKLNLEEIFGNEPLALIGNYPYNISSQIIFKMIDYKDLIPEMVGMFQKEVGERIVAPPGSKTYGIISVLAQAYYEGELLIQVGPESFDPPPKVQSVVIKLKRKDHLEIDCNPKVFKRVVKQAFSQRRKMLRNTMKAFIKGDDLLQSDFFLQRPEQLSVEQFITLTNWIEERQE
ncbi:MAG: 16S rRNA (adenine1518-N6/adenine1519-N6)-dimethyltransferase [Saprospiraceae bacterium]